MFVIMTFEWTTTGFKSGGMDTTWRPVQYPESSAQW